MSKSINLSKVVTAKTTFQGKTKFDFWNNIQVGDQLYISLELKPSGRSSRGMYAPIVKVENVRTGEEKSETFNLVQAYLTKVGVYD